MAEFTQKDANLKMLREADEVQDKTLQSVERMNKMALESEATGTQTLDELRRQAGQMDNIKSDLDDVGLKLKKSSALQDQFDRWAGNWLGLKKNKALKAAAAELQDQDTRKIMQVKEVYEQQQYNVMKRKFKGCGLVLVTDPSCPADDIFDPKNVGADSMWSIEYVPNSDPEGWTYGSDFNTLNNGGGVSSAKWNSHVRRRKWKYTEKKAAQSDLQMAIQERNNARKVQAQQRPSQASKIGYVPRERLPDGSNAPTSRKDDLDDESAAGLQNLKNKDKTIDDGLSSLDQTLSRLDNIAKDMREEAVRSTSKIDEVEYKLQQVNEQQTVVNQRLKFQLK